MTSIFYTKCPTQGEILLWNKSSTMLKRSHRFCKVCLLQNVTEVANFGDVKSDERTVRQRWFIWSPVCMNGTEAIRDLVFLVYGLPARNPLISRPSFPEIQSHQKWQYPVQTKAKLLVWLFMWGSHYGFSFHLFTQNRARNFHCSYFITARNEVGAR